MSLPHETMLNALGVAWLPCLLSLVAAAPPQTAVDPAASSYERLLQRYISGDYDGAVAEVTRHSAWEFEGPFEDALAKADYLVAFETTKFRTFDKQCTDRPDCPAGASNPAAMYRARDEFVRLVLAAMLLHTEAAFKTTDEQANAEIRLAQRAHTALVKAEPYLQGKPLPALRIGRSPVSPAGHFTTADVDRARHDWIVLVAVGFHARARLDALEKYLAEALKRYPRDPALELCLGVYYERRALADTVDVSLVRQLYDSGHEGRWRAIGSRLAASITCGCRRMRGCRYCGGALSRGQRVFHSPRLPPQRVSVTKRRRERPPRRRLGLPR